MLKKISFFLLTVTPFFGLISCSSIYKFYEFIPKNENKSLLKNQRIQEFVDSIFAQNEGQKQDYIINQINKNGLKISQELKYSLIFSKPYFRSINDEYLTTRENANYTIHSYLAKNWLFLLENIEKLSFIFNPYQTRFLKKSAGAWGRKNQR
ncbi:aromatic motif membrane protein [Mesomycoplasma hyopneumoniae]|uniref:aromatic motif membrane protein n=1 Tax=Mesomycoplasma hyopneumoniae TaxID=2099 RepID=UPI00385726B2